jgi:hypothetical protein
VFFSPSAVGFSKEILFDCGCLRDDVKVNVMGVNHGGTNPPRIGSGGTLIQVVPPDFCRFSKFQALAMDSSPQISTQIYATGACRMPSFSRKVAEQLSLENEGTAQS